MSDSRKQHWQRLRGVFRSIFMDDRKQKLSPAGAIAMQNLRELVSLEASPFSSDPLRMAYQVGRQDVVKHIIMMIELSDEQIARLDQTVQTETEMEALGLTDDRYFN